MQIQYVALAALAGCLLKLVDDAYDECLFNRRIAFGMNMINGIIAIVLMLDRDGFIVIGSVFWSSLFRGKVDNPAFRWGYLLVALVWGGLFVYLAPFSIDMELIALFSLCILSLFVMTKIHDKFIRKQTLVTDVLIERRHMHTAVILLCVPLGCLSITAFVGFALFLELYNLTGDVSKKIILRREYRLKLKDEPAQVVHV